MIVGRGRLVRLHDTYFYGVRLGHRALLSDQSGEPGSGNVGQEEVRANHECEVRGKLLDPNGFIGPEFGHQSEFLENSA